jgi:hypothetical protein
MPSIVRPFVTALGHEMTALFPRLTPGQQRALVDMARELTGAPLDRHAAWDRAGGLITLSEHAEILSNRLLDGVDQERLR